MFKRKEIKKLEKRDIFEDEISITVKEVKQKPESTSKYDKPTKVPPVVPASTKQSPETTKKIYSSIKR
jgi:hypothetical protein